MKNKRFYTPAYLRGTDFTEDQTDFPFVITSEEVDSYRSVFKADGWSFDRYLRNPVVFYQHLSHTDDPDNLVGITVSGPTEIVLENGTRAFEAIVRFEPADVNAKAEKIRKKIIAGSLKMASIGADVLEYHWGRAEWGEDDDVVYFDRQELVEWSVVTLGANPDALARNQDFITQVRSEKSAQELPPRGEGSTVSLVDHALEVAKRKR
jgi:phage head maturation protease